MTELEFLCPECGHGLRLRGSYFRVPYAFAGVIVALVAYAAGMRGESVFAIVCLGLFPMHLLLSAITMRLFPPDVESTGQFRGILYGPRDPGESSAAEPKLDVSGTGRSETPTQLADRSENRGTFTLVRAHLTLEGVVILGVAIILTLWLVWTAARPLIYRLAPDFGTTRDGPTAFPVNVHIGEETIAFTNGSNELWSCAAELGYGDRYRAGFAIQPRQTRELSYLEFRGSDTSVKSAAMRDAAREKIRIWCAGSSGSPQYLEFR